MSASDALKKRHIYKFKRSKVCARGKTWQTKKRPFISLGKGVVDVVGGRVTFARDVIKKKVGNPFAKVEVPRERVGLHNKCRSITDMYPATDVYLGARSNYKLFRAAATELIER